MLKDYRKGRRDSGFTLIEIVIVIAIAALILAAVLVFLPTAQKSRRDTARKDVIGKIASVVESYAANNGGTYPTLAQLNTQLTASGLKDPQSGLVISMTSGTCSGTGPGVGVWNYSAPTASSPYKVCTTSEDTTLLSS